MQDNEYEYAEYEAQNEREDAARQRREREDETNPMVVERRMIARVNVAISEIFADAASRIRTTEESDIEMERRTR